MPKKINVTKLLNYLRMFDLPFDFTDRELEEKFKQTLLQLDLQPNSNDTEQRKKYSHAYRVLTNRKVSAKTFKDLRMMQRNNLSLTCQGSMTIAEYCAQNPRAFSYLLLMHNLNPTLNMDEPVDFYCHATIYLSNKEKCFNLNPLDLADIVNRFPIKIFSDQRLALNFAPHLTPRDPSPFEPLQKGFYASRARVKNSFFVPKIIPKVIVYQVNLTPRTLFKIMELPSSYPDLLPYVTGFYADQLQTVKKSEFKKLVCFERAYNENEKKIKFDDVKAHIMGLKIASTASPTLIEHLANKKSPMTYYSYPQKEYEKRLSAYLESKNYWYLANLQMHREAKTYKGKMFDVEPSNAGWATQSAPTPSQINQSPKVKV